MSLQIGQVSKLLNMSPETIRFYEQQGIINPGREPEGKYRKYEPWDIFDLTDCVKYRNLGFSVKEVRSLMREADLKQVQTLYAERKEGLMQESRIRQIQLDTIRSFIRKTETAIYNIGNYWAMMEGEKAYIQVIQREGAAYSDYDPSDDLLCGWIQKIPFVKIILSVNPEDVLSGSEKNLWYYLTDKDYLLTLKLPVDDRVKSIPGGLFLHTILDMGEKSSFSNEKFIPVIEEALRQGYKITGKILGELFLRVMDSGSWHRYLDVMVPVEKI